MLSHKVQAKISKKGYLELKNLPFTAGTQVEITISKKKENKVFEQLIANDHVWAEEIKLAQYHDLFLSSISEFELYLGAKTARHQTDLEIQGIENLRLWNL